MTIGCIGIGVTLIVHGSHSDASPIPEDVPIVSAPPTPSTAAPTAVTPAGPGRDVDSSDAAGGSGAVVPTGAATTTTSSPDPGTSTSRLPGTSVSRPPVPSLPADTVQIPDQRVTAPIVGDCVIDGGTMEAPSNVHQTCRWAGSESLDVAAGSGITVITGHVNYVGQGQGAFARIVDLRPGDGLVTSGPRGATIRWSVTGVVAYAKSAGIPAGVFTRSAGSHRTLRLITCGGELQSDGNYDDNIVVTAVAD